ncbi:pentapeptide repeat-containing protein [Micromonospora sp. NPDC049049]|uniref:pentapeptide repeat-containing protein n=1 Tax=Micromonospora sp. NPDC049049 TaxID=3155495 RepID=UPI0033D75B27
MKLVFAVVAGIGGVAALVVAYRRQRVAEHANALAKFAHELAHAADLRADVTKALAEAADERAKIETDRNGVRLFNERFTKASEQLGSEKAAVRLAGVYAMAGLADDWREGRQTCIDVLCAYIRLPYLPVPVVSEEAPAQSHDQLPILGADAVRSSHEEREVRHTVIRLIGRHLRLAEEDATSWRGYDFDFSGAVFDGGDFSGTTFSGGEVSFAGVNFSGGETSFAGATFSGGGLNFNRATFAGGRVYFDWATFSGAVVHFGRASFADGDVFFDGATFSDGLVPFGGATFSGGMVSFTGATFSGADVDFSGARFCGGEVTFDGARFRTPPKFDSWSDKNPPDGLILPEA